MHFRVCLLAFNHPNPIPRCNLSSLGPMGEPGLHLARARNLTESVREPEDFLSAFPLRNLPWLHGRIFLSLCVFAYDN